MKLRRILVTIVLALTFIFGNILAFTPQFSMGKESRSNVVYAAPRSSSGGFKSGGFSSVPKSSTSGSYKSGSFFNTKPRTTTPYGGSSYNSGRRWSFFPLPIPIPFGNRGFFGMGYGLGYGIFSFFWSIIKIIVITVIILWIIRRFRRR